MAQPALPRIHTSVPQGALTLALLGLTLLLGACGQQADEPQATAAPATPLASTADAPDGIRAAPAYSAAQLNVDPVNNWLTTGGSLSNERFSPLDAINRTNVDQLKLNWHIHLNSGGGPQHSAQGDPLVIDGVIYMVTGANDVFALSLESGEVLWEYRANLEADDVMVCCGWVQRGVSVGEGRVYVGTLDARLLALDQQTGEVLWEVQVEDSSKGYSITGGTRYYNGRVFAGLAGGEFQTRGRVMAFDAATGETEWSFNTVPGPGEFGHETWPDYNDSWMYGGAPVWQTPAIDPELGMIYFSTGNASPDLNGSLREGDNLFTVSIVALDVNTGEYRWHFQQTRHDIWDYDSSSPVVLFDVEKDGVPRKGLSQISKSGYLFLLDRITGEPLTPIVDTPVPQVAEQFTAATQPIPQGDSMIRHCLEEAPEGWELVNNACTYTPFGREPVLYSPLAGSNWMPTSYDPQSGTLYVCASESVGGAVMGDWTEDDLGVLPGNMIMGGAFRLPQGIPRRAFQVAVDVTNHMRKWRTEVSTCTAPSMVTAGGLLLTGRAEMFTAIDSSNGDVLAEFLLDAGLYANPVVIEHEGEQLVLLYAGGSAYGPGAKGDSLYLLSLNGSGSLPTERPDGEVQLSTVMPITEPDLDIGQGIYMSVCNTCHGEDGQGGHAEGGAIPRDATLELIYATAITGVDEKMPSFAGIYTPEQIKSVAGYIRERVLQQ